MEDSEIRARVAEVAAPPGGWPNLAGDLAEVKFFLKQGQLDEAYDLLSILQRRYPGHPELADFARSSQATTRPDADVENLVDSVLAESSTLGGKVPRRRATPWDAPESQPVERRGRKLTTAHEVVRAALIEDVDVEEEATNPRAKVVVAEYAKNPRPARKPVPKVERTHAFEAIPPKRMPKVRLRKPKSEMPTPKLLREDKPKQVATPKPPPVKPAKTVDTPAPVPPLPEPSYANEGRPATVHMPPVRADDTSMPISVDSTPIAVDSPEPPPEPKLESEPKAEAAREPLRTVAVDALMPAAPFAEAQNHTMAVDALQPPTPFEGEAPETFEARKEQIKRATNKTGRRRRVSKKDGQAKRKRPRGVPPKRDPDSEPEKPRSTPTFGAGVLARFGR
jgi:hypothetical protein